MIFTSGSSSSISRTRPPRHPAQTHNRLDQLAHPRHQFGRDLDRLQDLQHHLVGRQEIDEVAHQHSRIDIDEALQVADHVGQAQLGSVGNHSRRSRDVILHIGRTEGSTAKQQFVSDQVLLAAQDGLAGQEEIQGMVGRRGGSADWSDMVVLLITLALHGILT
jgi:hypothetical protein